MATNVRQTYDRILEPVRGWFADGALESTGKISANVTIDPVLAGRVMHKNSSKEYEMGASGHEVPHILMKDSDDADVEVDSDSAHGLYGVGEATVTCLVALGHFEIQTRYYDENQTYAVNDLLTAQTSNSSSTTGGVVTNSGVTAGGVCVCGIVSDGVVEDKHGNNVLQWYTYFLPVVP